MKTIATRICLCLFILLFALSTSYAETNYSSLSTDELNSTVNAVKNELISRQIKENGYILVSDEYDVKIYFYGFKKNLDDRIQFIVNNASDKNIIVCIEKLYIENWDVLYNGYLSTVDSGKNDVGEADMDWGKCITSNEENASKIDVQFSIMDQNWNTLYTTQEKTFYIR